MSRLTLMDLAFFLTESEQSPKHVAGVLLFKKPKGSKADWVAKLAASFRKHTKPQAPFNQVIHFGALGGPAWRPAETFHIDQHVFYQRPDKVMSEEKLFAYLSKLHEPCMDRSIPMWEFHIIDKVVGNRFAIYAKIHHAYADGITMSRWMIQSLRNKAHPGDFTALWEMDTSSQKENKRAEIDLLKRVLKTGTQWRQVSFGISKLVTQLALEQFGLTKNAVALPFKASEDTPFTGEVTADRQFATAAIDMERLNNLRQSTRCTVNHIALTCIDGALRRYLLDQDIELDRPLSIQMPVNLRDKNDNLSGNKIGIVLVDLAPNTSDPYTRLREIGFTLRSVRNQIDSVPAIAVSQYTVVLAVLLELMQLIKLDKIMPAVSDTLVSNVPGPAEQLYLGDAKLEKMVPISTLPPGGQLNITLYSYAGTLHFGLVATKKVKQLNRLTRYIEEAFDELEQSVFKPGNAS